MKNHVFKFNSPPKKVPTNGTHDAPFTGNGDLAVMLSGTDDRVQLYISKADFWSGQEILNGDISGGIYPITVFEILLPHLAYAQYEATQDIDNAAITLSLKCKDYSAKLKIIVCADENTIIVDLERTFPYVSASAAFIPITTSGSINYSGETKDVEYTVRGIDKPEYRFPTYAIAASRMALREVSDKKERTVWTITVATNHDTASYKQSAIERALVIDKYEIERLYAEHSSYWKKFWSKSGVELADSTLEMYWYAGLYSVAIGMRNLKFPPGLYGTCVTSDSMKWFGDYHLNYNYEAPFCHLATCNHLELTECYYPTLNTFLPIAQRYSKEYLGLRGAYFPVSIGPLGMETDIRPTTKEHGHLFLGQKSNGAYACVIPMMHWYSTRDVEFAKRNYYSLLLSVAEFWEGYLVYENGKYNIYNDCFHEVEWYITDCRPKDHDDKNPCISICLIKMLMRMLIDISNEISENTEKIPKWQHILDNMPEPATLIRNGKVYLSGVYGVDKIKHISPECSFPISEIGKYLTPELFIAAQNTLRNEETVAYMTLARSCFYAPLAARLGFSYDEVVSIIYEELERTGLPNGLFDIAPGGIESSTAIPCAVNEMIMQSFEGILRLFPVWNTSVDASFHGLRANGAFIVDASASNGKIKAKVLSEKGMTLKLEVPESGYTITLSDGKTVSAKEGIYTVDTAPDDVIYIESM